MSIHSDDDTGAPVRLLTRGEVAGQLALSARTITRLVADGELACVRFGRARRFRQSDVEALIERRARLGREPGVVNCEGASLGPASKSGR
jgi:excisionase family DNA binding protein